MSGYAVFRYRGKRPEKASLDSLGWSNFLQSRVQQVDPLAPNLLGVRQTPVRQIPAVPSEVLWHASVVGYGEAALFVARYPLKGKPMTLAHQSALCTWVNLRAQIIAASHTIAVDAHFRTTIRRRPVYNELVESSEKVGASYLLGLAMAQICVPSLIEPAQPGISPPILHHVSLLKVANKCGLIVDYDSKSNVDLVGFDRHMRASFVEAKGDEGIYSAWVKAIYQCLGVVGYRKWPTFWTFPPHGLFTSVAFESSHAVPCDGPNVGGGVRTVVTEVPVPQPSSVRKLLSLLFPPFVSPFTTPGPLDSKGMESTTGSLTALRALATCATVQALGTTSEEKARWTICRFTPSGTDGNRAILRAALPTEMLERAKKFEDAIRERGLDTESAELANLGKDFMLIRQRHIEGLPEGYVPAAGDPFLAFPVGGLSD